VTALSLDEAQAACQAAVPCANQGLAEIRRELFIMGDVASQASCNAGRCNLINLMTTFHSPARVAGRNWLSGLLLTLGHPRASRFLWESVRAGGHGRIRTTRQSRCQAASEQRSRIRAETQCNPCICHRRQVMRDSLPLGCPAPHQPDLQRAPHGLRVLLQGGDRRGVCAPRERGL
jgi:hypothetical protein